MPASRIAIAIRKSRCDHRRQASEAPSTSSSFVSARARPIATIWLLAPTSLAELHGRRVSAETIRTPVELAAPAARALPSGEQPEREILFHASVESPAISGMKAMPCEVRSGDRPPMSRR